jgi:hypothetical protein
MIIFLGLILTCYLVAILVWQRSNKYLVASGFGALILLWEVISLRFGVSWTGPWYSILSFFAFSDMIILGAKGFAEIKSLPNKMGVIIGVVLILAVVALYLLIAGSLAGGALSGG